MKRVTAIIDLAIEANCPCCEETINILNSPYNDEDENYCYLKDWFDNRKDADKPNIKVKCSNCGYEFIICKLKY